MESLSNIIKNMAMIGLPKNCKTPRLEPLSLCIAIAVSAWNSTIGIENNHEQIITIIKELKKNEENLWQYMRTNDWKEIHNEMVSYKKFNHPNDGRKIVEFGYINDKVRIEWV